VFDRCRAQGSAAVGFVVLLGELRSGQRRNRADLDEQAQHVGL
jgi:hypothetical protein